MKIEGMQLGRSSKYALARKQYRQWGQNTRESKIYKAVLFAMCLGKCPDCGIDMVLSFNEKVNEQENAVTLDHTVPLRDTLQHSKYGLQIMCKKCNAKKA